MRRLKAFCVLAAAALLGCGDATGTLQGGDALTVDAGGNASGGDPCGPTGTHGGSRWQDLYACYFGPSGAASCGGSSCHGDPQSIGTTFPGGFLCGTSSDSCWQGMTSMIVPSGGAADPTSTGLYHALRKDVQGPNDTIPMPLTPADYKFSAAALMQISTWIQQGAKNN